MKKKALWSSRKDTLTGLQQTLSRFQDSLNLALQSAGLDVVLHRVGDLHPVLNTIQDQTTSMELSIVV